MLHSENLSFYEQLIRGPTLGEIITKRRLKRRCNVHDFRRSERQKACRVQIESLPRKGSELVMILTGDWNGWDLVPTVAELAGKTISHLRIATLGFNDRQSAHLLELLDAGTILNVSILVSEMFAAKSTREFATLKRAMQRDGCHLGRSRNHAKLMCFEMSDERKFAAHGSLNLRTCRCYEQMVLANSPDLHDFFATYIDDLVRNTHA